MTGYIRTCEGKEYRLPPLTAWKVTYGTGTPCDAFEIICIFEPGMYDILKKAVGFYGEFGGKRVFTGIVDEYEACVDAAGRTVSISGRGMAAVLLDNETEPVEYIRCSFAEIFRKHAEPYGIELEIADEMPAVSGYKVESGQSEWSALYGYTHYAAGITPRFSAEGKLVAAKAAGASRKIDDKTAVYDIAFRGRRYGVISDVLVKQAGRSGSVKVENKPFKSLGGNCRRVITVPKSSGSNAVRYTAAYQIERSMEEYELLYLSLPEAFAAFPGDTVNVALSNAGISGVFEVCESESGAGIGGFYTRLVLRPC